MVATSIGEEGLDIGEVCLLRSSEATLNEPKVDLIIAYDAQKSAIRMVSLASKPHRILMSRSCKGLEELDENVRAKLLYYYPKTTKTEIGMMRKVHTRCVESLYQLMRFKLTEVGRSKVYHRRKSFGVFRRR